ncbi:MAG TPA: bifunctional helix-turn-helix transcriptional regulator/GNAT family N-acetyltransferase [Solirubrobacteraceae bacterium]|jgi:DNA-binding MarR family transcriptional regulator/predicted N-acetyltransferase YhbS
MAVITRDVDEVRAFNRFYTRRIGVLGGMLRTPLWLPEARLLYELGRAPLTAVAELRRELGIDAGQLSRLLARLDGEGLVSRERSAADGRRQCVRLTAAGEALLAKLDVRSGEESASMLHTLAAEERDRVLEAMATIRALLRDEHAPGIEVTLRAAEPGELGWIVSRHGALYAQEYGWDERMEGNVASIVADYGRSHDPAREAVWIAQAGGRRAGSIMCVARSESVAQLRLLLVEPSARGLGVGSLLVEECLAFARAAGYEEIVLWTNTVLHGARRLYERAGFTLLHEEHEDWPDPVFQTWSRPL